MADGSLEIEASRRYIDDILNSLDLVGCNPVPTPMVKEHGNRLGQEDDEEIDEDKAAIYRHCVGVIIHLNIDRGDIIFTTRELTSFLKKPTAIAWEMLKRLGRYLAGSKEVVQHITPPDGDPELKVYSDTNWAQCRRTRTSVACGVVQLGGVTLGA